MLQAFVCGEHQLVLLTAVLSTTPLGLLDCLSINNTCHSFIYLLYLFHQFITRFSPGVYFCRPSVPPSLPAGVHCPMMCLCHQFGSSGYGAHSPAAIPLHQQCRPEGGMWWYHKQWMHCSDLGSGIIDPPGMDQLVLLRLKNCWKCLEGCRVSLKPPEHSGGCPGLTNNVAR